MLSIPRIKDSFWGRVGYNDPSGCWVWKGHVTPYGYGRVTFNGIRKQAHCWSWYLHNLPEVRKGLTLDHLCRNRACVNPDHLEIVSMRVNMLRGVSQLANQARQTHCLRGHEFTPENTKPRPNKYGVARECRECIKIRSRISSDKRSLRRRLKRETSWQSA